MKSVSIPKQFQNGGIPVKKLIQGIECALSSETTMVDSRIYIDQKQFNNCLITIISTR